MQLAISALTNSVLEEGKQDRGGLLAEKEERLLVEREGLGMRGEHDSRRREGKTNDNESNERQGDGRN